jgi:ribosomal silencing factor RsfS
MRISTKFISLVAALLLSSLAAAATTFTIKVGANNENKYEPATLPDVRVGDKIVFEWVLIDYVDVVVHIFLRDRRQFYALEELWGDAHISYIEAEPEAAAVGR